jgi:hypothetical protein
MFHDPKTSSTSRRIPKQNSADHPKLLILLNEFHVLLEMLENFNLFNFLDFPAKGFVVVDIGELCPELIPEELVSESVA